MKLKWFLIALAVCFIGIFASVFMIDNIIDGYIEEIKTVVNIEIMNETNDEVIVKREDDNIKIYINTESSKDKATTESSKDEATTETSKDEVTTESSKFEHKYVKVVTEKGLNIREKPDITSDVVGTINYGEEVLVINECDGWYETTDGFISQDYIE